MKRKWKQKITVHCLIKNEENWIWYALKSVIDWVDQILVFDTGSTDKTAEIIKTINDKKIIFEEKGEVNAKTYSKLRQEMIDKTKEGWLMILDGDEIWTEEAIKELREGIEKKGKDIIVVAVRYWNCLGDIFHYSQELEKKQTPFGPPGFWAGRCFRKSIPGLHVSGFYGFEGFTDKNGKQICELGENKILFLKNRFFHTRLLPRSRDDKKVMQRGGKRKYQLGLAFPEGTSYPQVFWGNRPEIVPDALRRFTFSDRLIGFFINPWLWLRTRLWRMLVYPKIEKAKRKGASDEELAELLKIPL